MQQVLIVLMLAGLAVSALPPHLSNLPHNQTNWEMSKELLQLNMMSLLDHVQEESSGECGEAWRIVFKEMSNKAQWPLRMFDSWPKIPDGFLQGTGFYLGHFDECLSSTDDVLTIDFTAQYCPVAIGSSNGLIPPITYGICVPSSCSLNDTVEHLNKAMANLGLYPSLIATTSPYGDCTAEKSKTFEAGDWAVIGFLAFFVCVALLSTAYDVHQRLHKKNDKPHPVLSSFSVYTNGKFLFSTSDGAGQMTSLHGLRFFSMSWVVLCHAYNSPVSFPAVNILDFFNSMVNTSRLPITNGVLSVDTFFFLSGLLVCFVFFRDIGKKGSYDVPLGYLHRYLRLTPIFAVVILFHATIFTKFASGPMWNTAVIPEAESCQTNWWDMLLYVQNYVDSSNLCVRQSWYLACDMQMYWISPLLLYPLYLWPVAGAVWLGLVLLAACWMLFGIAMENKLGPSTLLPGGSEPTTQFDMEYVNAYTRAIPWLVGVALGCIICGLKAKKVTVKLSPLVVLLGWVFSTAVCLSVIYAFDVFLTPVILVGNYTTLQAAFWLPFHRLGWALGLSWIVFACVHGYGGPINGFLSWGVFQPLGKLSYCVFLIHEMLQIYRLGTIRTGAYLTDYSVVHSFIADLIASNLVAVPLTLLFEIPISNLDRYYLRNLSILPWPRPQPKQQQKTDEESGRNNVGYTEEKEL